MVPKFGFVVILLGLALPAWSGDRPGSIAGYVRNAAGVPQMGAMVEVLNSAAQSLTVFTDEKGFYSAAGLLPGMYDIRVSAPSFLPSLRERVGLRAGNRVLLDVTLTSLFDAMKMVPVRGPDEGDDWKWVLRSPANRPILRFVDDPSQAVGMEKGAHELRGSLSFVAGSASEGFGSASDMSTGFSVQKSIFTSDTLGLRGNVGYGNSGMPASVLRASFSHKMADGSQPEIALTMRNLPAPETLPGTGLQALALSTSDDITFGDALELKFGSELQTVQFLGRVTAFRPFGAADFHLSPNTVIEYRYATSEPDDLAEKGFEAEPVDLSEAQPRVTMVGYDSTIERAHHQEISVSHRIGKSSLQLAAYYDRISDPALTGVGELSTENGYVLPDLYSGTFTYQGSNLKTSGVRVVAQRQVAAGITATLDYAYGGVLDLAKPDSVLQDAQQWMETKDRHTLAGKINAKLPKTNTQLIASYRWISGSALTPVDLFNSSAGQAEPYFSLFFRQPLPSLGFLPVHMEALVDLRNLLAEGYVPVLGNDGHTVYLVQSARAIRGGLAFTF
jgi:hypothetical protein